MKKGISSASGLVVALALSASCAVGVMPAVSAGAAGGLVAGPAAIARDGHSASTTQLGSYNWSGYADVGTTFTAVSANWVEPTVTCTKEDQWAIFWVGFDGISTPTVEQAGTFGWCYEGTPVYDTWWEMYPTTGINGVGTMNPGDHVTASVTYSAGTYTMKLTDHTTPAASFTEKQACGSGQTCSRSSAEWIAERPGFSSTGYTPLAHFGKWIVTGASATAGTTKGSISAFSNDEITMVDSLDNYALATPSALNAKGNGFTDTWKNSY